MAPESHRDSDVLDGPHVLEGWIWSPEKSALANVGGALETMAGM